MRKPTFVSLLVWINGGVPAALLLYDALTGNLGANPVKFAILTTGLLALVFLTLSLAITPLRSLTGWKAPFPARRTLGLWAAIYAFAHFGIFFYWDREADVASTWNEIVSRDYLWYGTAALVIFIPLTLTSTRAAISSLGRGWKLLHRLVYLAAIAAAIHYMKQGKVVTTQSIVFASTIGALLAYRVVAAMVDLRRQLRTLREQPQRGFAVVMKPKFWKGQLKVIATFDETPDVRTFRLGPIEGHELPFDYRPGQYMNLALTIDGKPVNRSYTIASSPTRLGSCELTVKREEMGTSSTHLHRAVRVGDLIRVSAPAGKFVFDERAADGIVLIAGGVGITPLMSKVRYLTDLAWPGEVYLIFSARTEADLIFREEIDYLARRHKNLRVTITLTRAGDGWTGARGRVTPELLRDAVPNLTRRPVHICGPTAMADATRDLLVAMGVPAANIAMESFTSPKSSAIDREVVPAAAIDEAAANGVAHTLVFARSDRSVEVSNEQTILEAAEDAGVAINFDCRSGICGQCKTRLVGGNVRMDADDALTANDRTQGLILACQAHCTGDVTVDA